MATRDKEAGKTAAGKRAAGKKGAKMRRGEDGFTIVWLAVTITVLNIWIAATLPLWSFQIKRDKNAELIHRGLQVAEGIRVYLARTGQYPTSFKQMTEHEPRCLRREWQNPMREDGRWGLIPVGTGGPGGQGNRGQQTGPDGRPLPGGGNSQNGGAQGSGLPAPGGEPREDGLPPGTVLSTPPGEDTFGEAPQTIAFRGVYHPGSEEGTRLFLDSDIVSEWQFTVELISAMRQGTPEAPLANPRPFPVDQIGRPWPPGVTPPIAMPTAEGQGGAGGGAPTVTDGDGHVGGSRRPENQQGGGKG